MGAATLGVPFALTEEAWTLGSELPPFYVLAIFLSSLVIVGVYAYFHYHYDQEEILWWSLLLRVVLIYLIAATVSAWALFLIQKLPPEDLNTALSMIVVVAFPACFASAVLDSLA